MKRIKVLKAYLIIWLFILYVVYTNAELLGVFFMATVIFSTAIVGLLAVGSLYQIVSGYDIMMLGGTFGALAYKKTGYEFYIKSIDSLLPANIAHMLKMRKSQQKMLFTQEESRNIIEWLDSKFRKQKAYINFFINTAMLIGLLGTFVGLVEAIDNMGQIILGLNGDIDIKQIMQDFSGPLSGMAIGFGASLFGVVCAVILGINGYILFRSQDTLISGVENWLKDRIIDIAPEMLGRSTASMATDLPEQRKSFMDIFLEQMNNFTGEISKLTKSNENFHAMAQTLTSMKAVMDEQQATFQKIAGSQENYVQKFDAFSEYAKKADEIKAQQQHHDKAAMQAVLEEHGQLLTQSANTLLALNNGIVNVNNKMELQHQISEKVVALSEQQLIQDATLHKETLQAVDQLLVGVERGTERVVTVLNQHENKLDVMIQDLGTTSRVLSEIYTQLEASGHVLLNIASAQTHHFDETLKAYSTMQEQMKMLDRALNLEITTLESLGTQRAQEHAVVVENQQKAQGVFETIAVTIETTKQTLLTVLDVQEIFKAEAKEASQESLQAVVEVQRALALNKASLESLLVAHENFHTRYFNAQYETKNTLQQISQGVTAENHISTELLQASTLINQTQKMNAEQERELLGALGDELARIEAFNQSAMEHKKEFEEAYFKHSDEKQTYVVAELGQKIEQTQEQLETMAQSLKNIEEVIARLDKHNALHGTGVADEIKGFFSSLFHKNS
ncbi:MotA/TolQ/ExbB proton channel family protein [Sulfurospirillum oryzae]|uniref:MotA/TolQ/ExbB proton channel family protein n=1 Tax=Sulfurospirillum oryzae TaxID=2976535 RepID=UPI0021E956D0|nr:MotA/TolQ/ExbB proton channel family protein [Sulfurospirillum oryzae]